MDDNRVISDNFLAALEESRNPISIKFFPTTIKVFSLKKLVRTELNFIEKRP